MINTIIIVFTTLIFLLFILSLSRNKETFHENNSINTYNPYPYKQYYQYSQYIPYEFYKDKPYNQIDADTLCNNLCIKSAPQQNGCNINSSSEYGWKPFGYWNNNWLVQKINTVTIPKYQLVCGCNIEY